MFFNVYPYTNFHELNLDEILRMIHVMHKEISEFEAVNKITNAGAWDITKQYQAWTIVSDNNIGYISLQPVPAGVAITNTDYWGLVADYDILITNLSDRISALENRLTKFAYIPEDFGAIGDGMTDDSAAIQAALDAAVNDGVGCVAFNGKTYKVNSALRADVGKISLYGNSTKLDMSTSTGGLILSNSNGTPYETSNKCLYGIEFIGNTNIDCITVSASDPNEAVSHFTIARCNIHDFRYGILAQDYTYLIWIMNTDIYQCDTCVRLLNGTDSGENISIIGCCLYNSDCGIYNASQNGAIHVSNTSLDYNTVTLESTTENRNYFVNSHIEGPGVIKGWANFECCWIILRNSVKWFDLSNGAIQRYDKCFIHTANPSNDATTGNGHIYFTNSEDNNISDFATCEFNGLANENAPKPGIVWGEGTAAGTTPWNATNAAVSKDTGEYETGTYSIKMEKIYGAGSSSSLKILTPRDPKSTHYQVKLRLKTASVTTLDVGSYLTEMPALNNADGSPYQVADRHDARNGNVVTTGDWQTVSFFGNTRVVYDDNAHYIVISLFNSGANTLYLDRIEVIDF